MSSARSRAFRPGLRAQLMLWTAAVLALSLAAGFAWVHHGLRRVLEAKNDAFLERRGRSWSPSPARKAREGGALESEIRREVAAYEAEGLVVVVRRPGRRLIAPATAEAGPGGPAGRDRWRPGSANPDPGEPSGALPDVRVSMASARGLASRWNSACRWPRPRRSWPSSTAASPPGGWPSWPGGRRRPAPVPPGAAPVARSIRTARCLNPADLSARLPRTGAGDELDQLAGTINDLLDRLASYHAQVTRFTADASHELRSPLGAIRAAIEVRSSSPGGPRNIARSWGRWASSATA